MAFLVNWMFRRRDKFDGPFFGGKRGRERRYGGGLIFGIVIGLRIWRGGGIHMGGLIYRGTY